MRTGNNVLGIYIRRARTRLQLRFANTGDEIEDVVWTRWEVCERGGRVKNELWTS